LSWLKLSICNIFFFKILWIATVFFHIVFLFYFFIFSKLYLSIFLYWVDWEFSFVFFFFKTLLIATVFLRMVFFCFYFFMIFSEIIIFLFYFLIWSWLKITVTICEESTVTFLANYCGLLQFFFSYDFFLFCYVFPWNCLCQFYFLNIKLVKNCNYK
jgi:hypothetical protein